MLVSLVHAGSTPTASNLGWFPVGLAEIVEHDPSSFKGSQGVNSGAQMDLRQINTRYKQSRNSDSRNTFKSRPARDARFNYLIYPQPRVKYEYEYRKLSLLRYGLYLKYFSQILTA